MHSQDIKTKNYWDQILNWPISKSLENTLQVSFKMLQINFRCGSIRWWPGLRTCCGTSPWVLLWVQSGTQGQNQNQGFLETSVSFGVKEDISNHSACFTTQHEKLGWHPAFPCWVAGSCTKVSSLDLLLVVVSRHQASPMQRFVLHHAKTQKASHANMRAIVSSKGKAFMSKTRRSRSWTVKAAFANCWLDSYLNSLFRYDIYI